MTPREQQVRILLARRLALENRRPVRADLLAQDALAEGIPAQDLQAALAALAETGLAACVRGQWTLLPPPFPQDVTMERATRMRLASAGR